MNYFKKISLTLLLPLISSLSFAQDEVSFSAGISSFASIQNATFSNGSENEFTYSGLQFLAGANFNDNVQAQLSVYKASESDLSELKISGNAIRANIGKGFQTKGFKVYGTIGLFNETIENANSSYEEKVNGLEYGAAIGYNFGRVALDWGFTVRDASDYETDVVFGTDTDVIVTTGFLALTGNF
jgi:hypothetical protein